MAAREQDDAIGHALLAQTNPQSLERPCYLTWLHFFVIRSNLIPDGHLWTSPEFSIPHYKLEKASDDVSLQELITEPFDLPFGRFNRFNPKCAAELPGSSVFAAHDPCAFYSPTKSPSRDARKRKAVNQLLPEVREQVSSPPKPLPPPRYFNISRPAVLPLSMNLASTSGTDIPPLMTLEADSSIMVTPATSARDEEVPSRADDKEKIDTFRVVDFAVVYLSRSPNSERIRKQVFALREFGQCCTPVLAEGKRPPQQEDLDAGMMIRLETLLKLAQRDITEKKHNFFERYGCKSTVGIAFSGPYWTFSIFRHDNYESEWSKAISPESSSHATILDTIFEAAESDPINPGGHTRLQELFRLYQRAEERPFQLVTGTHLECFPPD